MSPRGRPVPPPQLRAAERPRRPDGRAARTPRVSLARAVGGLPPPGPTPPSKGCCLQAHGHVSATWGARKPNQPESLDEGLDVTRLGAEAGHTGQQDRTDTRKTSRLRMWLRGPRRRPDGDHGLVGGVESPGLGMPRSNQTHIFNIRKPNSERESDFFQITGTGRISEQPPPIDPRSRQQLPPIPPQPSLGSRLWAQVHLTEGFLLDHEPCPHPSLTPASPLPRRELGSACELRAQRAQTQTACVRHL